MPLNRNMIRAYPTDSAIYVFLHGLWRKQRGKKEVSATFGGITNPAHAFDLASTLFQHLATFDHIADEGEKLLTNGLTYTEVRGDQLAAMIRAVVEECEQPHVLLASLIGMIEIPRDEIVELAFTTLPEYRAEYLTARSRYSVASNARRYERKLANMDPSGITDNMLLEMYRSRGGLIPKSGVIVNLVVCDRYGDPVTL